MSWSQVFASLMARKGLILFTSVAALIIMLIIAVNTTPKYSSTATLVIDFKNPESDTLLPAVLQQEYLDTQLAILKGPHVALRVIESLNLSPEDIVDTTPGFLDGIIGAVQSHPLVMTIIERVTSIIQSDDIAAEPEIEVPVGPTRGEMIKVLLDNLRAAAKKNTRVVDVGYTAPLPEDAQLLANAFAQEYINANLELNIQPARKSAEWIDDQLAELRQNLEMAQSKLAAYQQEKGILASSERLDIEISHVNSLTMQLAQAQAEAEQAESRFRQMNELRESGSSLDTIPAVLSNLYVQNLKSELRIKEAALADASTKIGENHPDYQRAVADVSGIRRKIAQEISAIFGSLAYEKDLAEKRAMAVEESLALQKKKMLELRQTQADLPALTREVQSAQENYDQALAQYQQYNLQSRVTQTNVTILNPASTPSKPSGPGKKKLIVLAGLLGLMFGIFLSIVLELKNKRIRNENSIVYATGLPYLGSIERS